LPPDLDKAFADLGAEGGRATRSRTGPLPKDVLHKDPPTLKDLDRQRQKK
jgi:hypothetical protein